MNSGLFWHNHFLGGSSIPPAGVGHLQCEQSTWETLCPTGLHENTPISDKNGLINSLFCLELKSKKNQLKNNNHNSHLQLQINQFKWLHDLTWKLQAEGTFELSLWHYLGVMKSKPVPHLLLLNFPCCNILLSNRFWLSREAPKVSVKSCKQNPVESPTFLQSKAGCEKWREGGKQIWREYRAASCFLGKLPAPFHHYGCII